MAEKTDDRSGGRRSPKAPEPQQRTPKEPAGKGAKEPPVKRPLQLRISRVEGRDSLKYEDVADK